MKSSALHMLGKASITDLHLSPWRPFKESVDVSTWTFLEENRTPAMLGSKLRESYKSFPPISLGPGGPCSSCTVIHVWLPEEILLDCEPEHSTQCVPTELLGP